MSYYKQQQIGDWWVNVSLEDDGRVEAVACSQRGPLYTSAPRFTGTASGSRYRSVGWGPWRSEVEVDLAEEVERVVEEALADARQQKANHEAEGLIVDRVLAAAGG